MNKIEFISGKCIPLEMNDVDTDLIIPAQYCASISKTGYGLNLFRRLRDQSKDFVFNQIKYENSNILISQKNFGCGSSREAAVWALKEYGINVVIANSFADIFSGNCLKNKILLITLELNIIYKLIEDSKNHSLTLKIDLINNTIRTSLNEIFQIKISDFQKSFFINDFNEIDFLLSYKEKVLSFKNYQLSNKILPILNQ